MANRTVGREFDQGDSLLNDADVDESLWDSPVKPAQNSRDLTSAAAPKATSGAKPPYIKEEAIDAHLRQELANVRTVNEGIEGVIQSLERAKSNMKTVNHTVGAASSLLNTWTRILSQTEYNQRLILDPSWHGTSQDLADIEADTIAKQQAAARKEAEEQERRSAAARRTEEEEQRRAEAAKPPNPSTRGRGKGSGRPGVTQTSYVSMGGVSANTSMSSSGRGSNATRRTTSGIGRGRGGRART